MTDVTISPNSEAKPSFELSVIWRAEHREGDIEEAVSPVRRWMERKGRAMRATHPWIALRLEMPGHRKREAWLASHEPTSIVETQGNALTNGGGSCLWQTLIGNGTGTAGQALTYFNNANAALGVGTSTSAFAATQNNLIGTRDRNGMDATYPLHSDGTSSGSLTITFRSTFGTGDANFAWEEFGVFNSATDAVGRMLTRKVSSNGTKSGGTSTFTVTLAAA
jgi:hypothetical protein